jgi:uncharacterized membrane protein YphA (DoxX/SURF4 family)
MAGYAQSKGVPYPRLAVLGSAVLLIVGLLGVIFDVQAFIGSILVAVFLAATAVMIHNFWTVEDQQAQTVEMTQFLKNIALAAATITIGALMS